MTDRRSFLAAGAVAAASVGSRPPLARAEDKPGKTKNTRFAVNVEMWWRKEKDFLKRLEAAAALGFPAVEFWPFETKNVPAVAETCQRLGLDVAQFTAWGFKPGLNDPKNHTAFVEKVELARRQCVALDQDPCDPNAAALARTLGWFERTGQLKDEVALVRSRISTPNFQVVIGSSLIRSLTDTIDADIEESVPIHDQVTVPRTRALQRARTLRVYGSARATG